MERNLGYLLVYLYTGLCLFLIAKKTGKSTVWAATAWIPLVNVCLLISCADKEWWWFFLLLIPLVNIIILVIIFMGVAEQRGKASWLGILMILPVVNLVVWGYLALSE